MPAAFISAGLNYLGAQEQASATEAAANTSAAAQRESARLAAEAAKFRPVGITTRFGSSNFQMSPEGYLTGAGYNVSPELKAYQDRLMGLTGGALTQAEQAQQQYAPLQTAATGLFGLVSSTYNRLLNKLHKNICNSNRTCLLLAVSVRWLSCRISCFNKVVVDCL